MLELLNERKLSLRQARNLTGINHVTISDMAGGVVPSAELVAKWALAVNEPVRKWLKLAKYDELLADDPGTLHLWDGLQDLAQEFGIDHIPWLSGGKRTGVDVETAEAFIKAIRGHLEQVSENKKRPGE